MVEIREGYSPGVIGRVVEMHGRYYSAATGFGQFFEGKVAAGLAEFTGRLGNSRNRLWTAVWDGEIVGSVAIDGEDLGAAIGHLRWFIVAESMQGQGVGRRPATEALGFCDQQGFPETHLWTFKGLDAARKLYESFGFALVEEFAGTQWGSKVMEQRFVRKLPALSKRKPTPPKVRFGGVGRSGGKLFLGRLRFGGSRCFAAFLSAGTDAVRRTALKAGVQAVPG